MKKIGVVCFDRCGSSGNIFCVMGMASRVLKKNGLGDKVDEMINRVTSSGSYEEALGIIGEYVHLKEVREG